MLHKVRAKMLRSLPIQMEFEMFILRALLNLFMWPGNAASRALSINITEDGGQVRSLINGIVWGTLLLTLSLIFHGG